MLRRIIGRGWSVAHATWTGWRRNDGTLLSAATAYYAAFSLFPLCLVLIAGLGFFGRYSAFVQTEQRDLLDHVAKNVSPWLAGELEGILTGVQAQALLGGPLGLLALDPGGHRRLYAIGERLRPHLGHARAGRRRLAGRHPGRAVGPPVGLPHAAGHRGHADRGISDRRGPGGRSPLLAHLPAGDSLGTSSSRCPRSAATRCCWRRSIACFRRSACLGRGARRRIARRRGLGHRAMRLAVWSSASSTVPTASSAPDGRDVLVLLRQRRGLPGAEFVHALGLREQGTGSTGHGPNGGKQ